MPSSTASEILQAASVLGPELSQWRQHLHRQPELSGEEAATGAFVAGQLETLGVPGIQRHFAGTCAVIAEIVGEQPGPTVALRADMDALPIQDAKQTAYASQITGVMHACGHDAHTTMLLGAAHLLLARRDQLQGTVRLIFQPSEERSDLAGAAHLIEAGVLQDVAAIFGLHVFPDLPAGELATRPGAMMASADTFEICLRGKGGHAARPHQCVDPILMAAQAVNALHQIVSRRVDPLQPAVLTIGRIAGGQADNVIPENVVLGGTVRAFDEALRQQIPEWIEQALAGISASHGGSFSLHYERGTAPVYNHPETTAFALQSLARLAGPAQVKLLPDPSMGGEDFGAYLQAIPGTFFRLGTGNAAAGICAPLHSPHFDIDEAALPLGAAALATLALDWLATQG